MKLIGDCLDVWWRNGTRRCIWTHKVENWLNSQENDLTNDYFGTVLDFWNKFPCFYILLGHSLMSCFIQKGGDPIFNWRYR